MDIIIKVSSIVLQTTIINKLKSFQARTQIFVIPLRIRVWCVPYASFFFFNR